MELNWGFHNVKNDETYEFNEILLQLSFVHSWSLLP